MYFISDEYYNKMSDGYNELHGAEQLEKVKIVQELLESDGLLNFNSNLFLFDIGCGTGISTSISRSISISASTHVLNRAGLDRAIKLLEQANDHRLAMRKSKDDNNNDKDLRNTFQYPEQDYSNHQGYIRGLAEAVPIKDNGCNIVLSVTAVHNFSDIRSGIHELHRITKDRAVISILQKAKHFKEIIELIKKYFIVIKTLENDFDRFYYLQPK